MIEKRDMYGTYRDCLTCGYVRDVEAAPAPAKKPGAIRYRVRGYGAHARTVIELAVTRPPQGTKLVHDAECPFDGTNMVEMKDVSAKMSGHRYAGSIKRPIGRFECARGDRISIWIDLEGHHRWG
jgi:hypothetical protein